MTSGERPQTQEEGEPLAIIVNVALEAWEKDSAPGISPMGNPLPPGAFDTAAASWAEYGVKRGMPRLLAALAGADAHATVMISAQLCETHPGLVQVIHRAGHDICAHGYAQNQLPALMTRETEAASITRCADLLEQVTGKRPTGWISPRGTKSVNTSSLLVRNGFEWYGDCFDDDRPYSESTPHGSILAIPLTMEVNDLPMAMKYGVGAEAFLASFVTLVESAMAQPDPPTYIDLTVHAHVGGRPHLVSAFIAALQYAKSRPGVRLTTRDALASSFRPEVDR